jgi:hypothetical protein
MIRAAMRGWWTAVVALPVMLVGCSTDDEPEVTTVRKSYSDPLLDRFASNYDYEKGGDGTSKVVSKKRSQYEGSQASGFNKSFQGKNYQTGEVDKAPWWGRKGYEKQVWNGGKNASEGSKRSRFGSRKSTLAGRSARGAGEGYKTGSYATGAAYEQGTNRLGKPRDAITENQGRAYPDAAIIGWEEKRKMDLGQTKGILGR